MTLTTIEKEYQDSLDTLYTADEIRQMFLIVLDKLASLSPSQFLTYRDEPVDKALAEQMYVVLDGLRRGEPVQHILGEAHFYGMTLMVSKDTLIPRPETEELVDLIVRNHRQKGEITVIDIGTGSGCIAIALAKHLPLARVLAIDVSRKALDVARTNAELQGQEVSFVLGDILEWEVIFSDEQQFDVIVSNPPYITPKEKQGMHRNVLNYEPHLALFVEEEAPLLFYDYIADFALSHLKAEGMLYFEINQYLGQETADMLRKKGFRDVEVLKDINGVDRMIAVKWGDGFF